MIAAVDLSMRPGDLSLRPVAVGFAAFAAREAEAKRKKPNPDLQC